MRRWLVPAACALIGCQIVVVDLGSNEGAPQTQEPAPVDGGNGDPVVTKDCPHVTQAEVEALYGTPCDSTCRDGEGAARGIESSAELISVTAGKWRTCSGEVPWPAGVAGLEFQSGCTLFLLYEAPDGGLARGVEVDDQGTFDVVETRQGDHVTRAVELHFPGWKWLVDVTTSDCPHRLELAGKDARTTRLVGVPTDIPPLQ